MLFIGSLIACSAGLAGQAEIDKETARYAKVFAGDNFEKQKSVLDQLKWSGVSTPAVYDAVADKLVKLKNAKGKAEKDQASWFAKALGYSGNEKYRATLQDIATNAEAKKVSKYANEGLINLDQYKKWNPVISANVADAAPGRLKQARVANMLRADDYWLMRLGAKRLYRGHKTDAKLVAIAAERLKSEYPKLDKDNAGQIDGLAWLIKAVAESGDRTYYPLMVEVGENASVKKVKKYGKKYAGYLK